MLLAHSQNQKLTSRLKTIKQEEKSPIDKAFSIAQPLFTPLYELFDPSTGLLTKS
jgi:hypothetical protein